MYQALYRKYRPTDFDSVVGQNSIITTLKNSIVNNNFSHAYMFFGPRGTGKTTVSKIFARNINCNDPIDGNACGKCTSCEYSFSKNCVDIIEIDAASNNGVDEIRELKNKISLVPTELKYKVYIVDEVHMLSIGAFNALLKTLEEPPEHAIFILATTDPQKVPETIISRCQCFSFKRISNDIIVEKLKEICKKEKIKIDDDVLENISIMSDGGLRDALGLLDKMNSYTNSKITMKEFVEVNGIISSVQIENFVENVIDGNIKEVLNSINEFDKEGKNLIQIANQILNYCRNYVVDYYLNNKKNDFSIDIMLELTNLLNEKMFDIKKSGNTRIFFEMLILKFINKFSNKTTNVVLNKEDVEIKQKPVVSKVDKKIEEVKENKVEIIEKKVSSDEKPLIKNIDDIMKARINNILATADKNIKIQEENNMKKLNDYTFDQKIGYLVCNLLDSELFVASENGIIIGYEFESNVKQNLNNLDKLTDVYNKITKSNKSIAIISKAEWEIIKNKYIDDLKNKIKYEIVTEPEPIFEDLEKDDIISNSAVELFGDIVEFE